MKPLVILLMRAPASCWSAGFFAPVALAIDMVTWPFQAIGKLFIMYDN